MNNGITPAQIFEDLRITNDFADEYAYGTDDTDSHQIEHYGEDGQITGTQIVSITVGPFKPSAAG